MKLKELWRRSKNEDISLIQEVGFEKADEKTLRVVGLLKSHNAGQGWNDPPAHYEDHLLGALRKRLGKEETPASSTFGNFSEFFRVLTAPKMAWSLSFVVVFAFIFLVKSNIQTNSNNTTDQMFSEIAKRQGAEESHRWLASLGDPLIRAQSVSSATDILARQLEEKGAGAIKKVFGSEASKL